MSQNSKFGPLVPFWGNNFHSEFWQGIHP